MDTSITLTYQGKPIDIYVYGTEGDDETEYKVNHSLVISQDPARIGIMDTFHVYGMQYSQDVGHSPNLSETMIARSVVVDRIFRSSLIKYAQKYVEADDATVLRAIGRDNTDIAVAANLARLPKKRADRESSRVHMITNLLSRIAHTPIEDYLDYGTGDATIASTLADTLGSRGQGVDVFEMERPIPTLVIKQGQRLPDVWSGKFQLITALSVFHHVRDQQAVMEDLYRVLAPGGILIMREHDFRDMRTPTLLKTLSPVQVKYGIVDGPFYRFLDAIHVVSMAISGEDLSHAEGHEFFSHYRPRYEWHDMLADIGFTHICTNMHGIEQMDINLLQPRTSNEENWIELNPQRVYESVYRKEPTSTTRLVVEYRTSRDLNLGAFFPRIGGREGQLPDVQAGINYDEEILAYMTPWFAAQETSRLISRLVREKYEQQQQRQRRVRPFGLFDGTGGAGGNLIAFVGNRDINTINVYERVPHFYKYLLNNAQLYTRSNAVSTRDGHMITHMIAGPEGARPVEQRVYLHNTEFPLNTVTAGRDERQTIINGSVLFLDVPWVHEGCGYKLSGYLYGGVSLEQVARDALDAGAIMVLFKLPPNYRLGVRHEKHELGKETLYAIFPWNVRERRQDVTIDIGIQTRQHPVPSASQQAPTETRTTRMERPARVERVERPRTTPAPIPHVQPQPTITVPTEYTEILQLVEQRYPQLREEAYATLPFDPEAIENLRQQIIRAAEV